MQKENKQRIRDELRKKADDLREFSNASLIASKKLKKSFITMYLLYMIHEKWKYQKYRHMGV